MKKKIYIGGESLPIPKEVVYLSPFEKVLKDQVGRLIDISNYFMKMFKPEISTFIDEFLKKLEGPNGIGPLFSDVRSLITSTLAMIPGIAFLEEPLNFATPILRTGTLVTDVAGTAISQAKSAAGKFSMFKQKIESLFPPLTQKGLLQKGLLQKGLLQKGGNDTDTDGVISEQLIKAAPDPKLITNQDIINDIKKKCGEFMNFFMSGLNVALVIKPKFMSMFNTLMSIVGPKLTRIKDLLVNSAFDLVDAVPVVNTVKKTFDLTKSFYDLYKKTIQKGGFAKRLKNRSRKFQTRKNKRITHQSKTKRR
jgi:hypothetical protein